MDQCRICGHVAEMKTYEACEMMYGSREAFTYIMCPNCGCFQIREIPSNLGDYYKDTYYSFDKRDGSKKASVPQDVQYRILDVGCGSGEFLCNLAANGMEYLHGCDPFVDEDIEYENGVKIFKRQIHDMEGEYDIIYMNDSFEHVTDPHEVIESAARLLAPNGMLRIKLPVMPNAAFDAFGTDWYQLDAPRHIFLHSKQSMDVLAAAHGLKVVQRTWDSNNSQFARSYLYSKGIPFRQQTQEVFATYFTQETLDEFTEVAREANAEEYGDHAIFVMMHA